MPCPPWWPLSLKQWPKVSLPAPDCFLCPPSGHCLLYVVAWPLELTVGCHVISSPMRNLSLLFEALFQQTSFHLGLTLLCSDQLARPPAPTAWRMLFSAKIRSARSHAYFKTAWSKQNQPIPKLNHACLRLERVWCGPLGVGVSQRLTGKWY